MAQVTHASKVFTIYNKGMMCEIKDPCNMSLQAMTEAVLKSNV